MTRTIIFLFLILIAFSAGAQDWKLQKNSEGIKIYTATMAGSDVKALKVETTAEGKPSQLAALLLDAGAQTKWVYSTKSSSLLKKLGNNEVIFYSEKSMPWPVTNRDVIMNLRITQDPNTLVMTANSDARPVYIPKKNGLVRIPMSKVVWTVKPIDKNHISIDYVIQVDPGGDVPAWLINMFITKGPFETFRKLKKLIISPPYRDAQPDFIKDM